MISAGSKKKKFTKQDLSRSPEESQQRGNRLNLSSITGNNTGYSMMLGNQDSDGGGS